MEQVVESWRIIQEFPNYEISNLGRVANRITDVLIQPSTTRQGALKVGLVKNGIQYTRSVKVLVAEAFVEGRTATFDTPVLLDGDQLNCVAHNLVWRPRWHAWNYTYQFHEVLDIYRMGPVVELSPEGIVLGAYLDVVEVGVTYGLLFKDVWKSMHTRRGVFPTGQIFVFANKV